MATNAHSKKVYVKSTNSAPVSADEVDGITDCSVNRSASMLETTDFKGDAYRTRISGIQDASISMSGDYEQADAPQTLIRTSHGSGATIYVTVLEDGTNGYTYPCLVENYELGGGVDDKNTFSASFVLNGTPIVRP